MTPVAPTVSVLDLLNQPTATATRSASYSMTAVMISKKSAQVCNYNYNCSCGFVDDIRSRFSG